MAVDMLFWFWGDQRTEEGQLSVSTRRVKEGDLSEHLEEIERLMRFCFGASDSDQGLFGKLQFLIDTESLRYSRPLSTWATVFIARRQRRRKRCCMC
jgi:hypothetical protein